MLAGDLPPLDRAGLDERVQRAQVVELEVDVDEAAARLLLLDYRVEG